MKSFLKLSIAAVLFGAMMLSTGAFAAPVTADSTGKLDVGGVIWVMAGYYQANEIGGEAPTSTLEVADESRLNVSWAFDDKVTAHWEFWQREQINQADSAGTYMMGWITWKPTPELMIEAGQLEDPSWTARAVEWEVHNGTNSIGSVGAFNMGFVENSPGVDITYNAGVVKVGLALIAADLVGGASGGTIKNASDGAVAGAANNPGGGSTANTYAAHVEYNSDMIWGAFAYYSATKDVAATDADGNAAWGDSESFSDTGYIVSVKANLGVGDLRVQYWGVDGDTWDNADVDAPTDLAATFRFFMGEAWVALEYDMLTNGGVDDKGELADATYTRVAYRMPIATNSSIQFEYEMSNDGNSTASKPGVGWSSSF